MANSRLSCVDNDAAEVESRSSLEFADDEACEVAWLVDVASFAERHASGMTMTKSAST